MSVTADELPLRQRRGDWALPVGLIVAMALLVVGGNLAGNGELVGDQAMMGPLAGWADGSLLRVFLVWVASWFSVVLDPDTALVLLYVALSGFMTVLTYRFLRISDWPAWQALLAVLLLSAHAVLVYAVTTASGDVAIILACAALVPAMRRLESVGDVQAIINYGLTLPLLLLAGPPLAALILPLALLVPLREQESLRRPQVFLAMVLVGLVPTLIIIAGVLAMSARAGIGLDVLAPPFLQAFAPVSRPLLPSLVLIIAVVPVAFLPLVHSAIPDRRRKVLSSVSAVALPVYLAVGRSVFDWHMAPWTPAAAMFAVVLAWLCASRVRPWMRQMTLVLLALSVGTSWLLAPMWADPAWLKALWPIHLFHLS